MKTVRVGLCVPVTVEVSGVVDESGEVVVDRCQVLGEGLEPRHLYEHLTDDDWDALREALER